MTLNKNAALGFVFVTLLIDVIGIGAVIGFFDRMIIKLQVHLVIFRLATKQVYFIQVLVIKADEHMSADISFGFSKPLLHLVLKASDIRTEQTATGSATHIYSPLLS